MKIQKAIVGLFLLAALCSQAWAEPPQERPSVKDEKTGISVRVKDDDRTLIATDKLGKVLWEKDVFKAVGSLAAGQKAVRHLSLNGEQVVAVFGKHSFANFELGTGKLLTSGSD